MCIYVIIFRCSLRPEEDMESPGTDLREVVKLPDLGTEPNLGPLKEQQCSYLLGCLSRPSIRYLGIRYCYAHVISPQRPPRFWLRVQKPRAFMAGSSLSSSTAQRLGQGELSSAGLWRSKDEGVQMGLKLLTGQKCGRLGRSAAAEVLSNRDRH